MVKEACSTMKKLRFIQVIVFTSIFLWMFQSSVFAKSYGWGYQKNSSGKVPDIGMYRHFIETYDAYYADLSGEKNIYLTFDNGYEQGYTAHILDVLKEENVPATFFVTGHYVESEPELIKRMVDEGHIIGNHSDTHPDFTRLSKEDIKRELDYVKEQVAKLTNQKEMHYLRPPRGTFNEKTLQWTSELGYFHIFWSLAFLDWKTKEQKGWKYAYEQIMEQIHPGAIILLHTVSSDNAESLSQVIKDLKEEGYQFKSLDDLVFDDILPNGLHP